MERLENILEEVIREVELQKKLQEQEKLNKEETPVGKLKRLNEIAELIANSLKEDISEEDDYEDDDYEDDDYEDDDYEDDDYEDDDFEDDDFEDEHEKEYTFTEIIKEYENGFKGIFYDNNDNLYRIDGVYIDCLDKENDSWEPINLTSVFLNQKFKKEKKYITSGEAINKIKNGQTAYFECKMLSETLKGKACLHLTNKEIEIDFFNRKGILKDVDSLTLLLQAIFTGVWYQ